MKRTPTPRPRGAFIARQRRRLLTRDGGCCNWCRAPFTEQSPATLDHVVPLSYGGSTNDDNAVLACDPCNTHRSHVIRCSGCAQRVRSFSSAVVLDRRAIFHALCAPAAHVLMPAAG